jgi:hypothetical protein
MDVARLTLVLNVRNDLVIPAAASQPNSKSTTKKGEQQVDTCMLTLLFFLFSPGVVPTLSHPMRT